MFIKEIISEPHIVDGRTFVERTIKSKFKDVDTHITTIFMDNKPIVKQYLFENEHMRKYYWKVFEGQKHRIPPMTYVKKLDVMA